MTFDNSDAALDRIFNRTEEVLQGIEEGDDVAVEDAVRRINKAAPWDLVHLGHAFVKDQINAERSEDERLKQQLNVE